MVVHHRGGDTAPTASSLSPASGVSGVVAASNVTATFSKDVIPSTISFVLKAGSTTVPAAVTYDVTSRIVTLDPTANLTPGTTYTATLSGAQDVAGTTMTSTSWSFTTATANTTGPVISSQTPASGATGVLVASNVSATLSESVIPSTISFVLKNGSTTVGSAITYDVASHTVTLDPTANLAASTTYTATLSVPDVSGNTMSPVSWSFTTVAADIAPTVSAQSPASAPRAYSSPATSRRPSVSRSFPVRSASCSRMVRQRWDQPLPMTLPVTRSRSIPLPTSRPEPPTPPLSRVPRISRVTR